MAATLVEQKDNTLIVQVCVELAGQMFADKEALKQFLKNQSRQF